MDRKQFIKSLAVLPLIGVTMKIKGVSNLFNMDNVNVQMPVLFLGHGNPMNAIQENEFVTNFQKLGKELPRPKAILCISAHWETKGTFVTAMEKPRTIHDFSGFPKELFDVQYPSPGSPELATETKKLILKTDVQLDYDWGLDHGAWSVIKHLYPDADVPVIQMSLDYTKSPKYHYELAKELAQLRKKGVLIIGSGNIVHNLSKVAWDKINEPYAFDWALEASDKIKKFIENKDHEKLINYKAQGKAFELAIPTPDHYLPLIYALGLQEKNEEISFFNDKPVAGSLTMTSIKVSS